MVAQDLFRPRRLVIFDLDGTLYDQRKLRRHMLGLLLGDALRRRRLTVLRVLRAYRRRREALAEAECRGFEPRLVAETAAGAGVPEALVRAIVEDWIATRPLRALKACVVPGAETFFERLCGSGVTIGVLSDYAAEAKLAAMGLVADHVVAATDPEVAVLKPNARGLARLLELAECPPEHALMIGDRPERDGTAAQRLGVPFLLRSNRARQDQLAIRDFTDIRLRSICAMSE